MKNLVFFLSVFGFVLATAFTVPSNSNQSTNMTSTNMTTDSIIVKWNVTGNGSIQISINGNVEIPEARGTDSTVVYTSYYSYGAHYNPDAGHKVESHNAGYSAPEKTLTITAKFVPL